MNKEDLIGDVFFDSMGKGDVQLEEISITKDPCVGIDEVIAKVKALKVGGKSIGDIEGNRANEFYFGLMKGIEIARRVKFKISNHRSDILQLHLRELLLELKLAFRDRGDRHLSDRCSKLLEELKKEETPWGTLAELVQSIRDHDQTDKNRKSSSRKES